MQRIIPGLALVLTFAHPAAAEEKAHEHGSAALNIAVEDDGVEMELIAPGADIVGFEHAPGSDDDRAAVKAAVDTLQQSLFKFPDAAGCELEAVGIYSSLLPDGKPVHFGEHHHDEDHKDDHKDEHHADKDDHGHKDEHDHDDHAKEDGHEDHEDGEAHAEFRVHYHYECKDAAAVTGFDTSYFTAFSNAKELDVSAITAAGQAAAELTGDNTSIEF